MKFRVYAIYTASKYLGEIDAEDRAGAEEKAYEDFGDKMHATLCHQCSGEIDLNSDVNELDIFEVEP